MGEQIRLGDIVKLRVDKIPEFELDKNTVEKLKQKGIGYSRGSDELMLFIKGQGMTTFVLFADSVMIYQHLANECEHKFFVITFDNYEKFRELPVFDGNIVGLPKELAFDITYTPSQECISA